MLGVGCRLSHIQQTRPKSTKAMSRFFIPAESSQLFCCFCLLLLKVVVVVVEEEELQAMFIYSWQRVLLLSRRR